MIGILDYGIGNPRSILRMCETSGLEAQIVPSSEKLATSTRLILPGVGSFDRCAIALDRCGLATSLKRQQYENPKPLLGICVGAQLLGVSSEEGVEAGLGLMNHTTVRLRPENHPVPHMGWQKVNFLRSPNFHSPFEEDARFYFSHSFVIQSSNDDDKYATFNYENTLDAMLLRENIVAVQFHPEKSHRFGRRLIEWFGNWAP